MAQHLRDVTLKGERQYGSVKVRAVMAGRRQNGDGGDKGVIVRGRTACVRWFPMVLRALTLDHPWVGSVLPGWEHAEGDSCDEPVVERALVGEWHDSEHRHVGQEQ